MAEGPGAIQIGSTWYLYFAAAPAAAVTSGYRRASCIGVATLPVSADITTTPFTIPAGAASLFCDPQDGYATNYIDPSPFYDPTSNKYYLTYKTTTCGH